MSEAIRFVVLQNEEQREMAIRWARNQESNKDFRATPGSVMLAAVKEGQFVGVFEILSMPVCNMVFADDGSVFQTNRVFELLRAGLDIRGIMPLIPVQDDSPLKEYAEKKMKPVMRNVQWYRYE